MRKRTDVIVGAVIILSAALLFLGMVWLNGTGFRRDSELVQARFREIGQLRVGGSVKLRGVPVGRVAEIELEPGGNGVIVALRIQREVVLPDDPVVLLSPESFFGAWQAEIHPRNRFPRYVYAESPNPQVLPGVALPDMSRLTAVADEIAQNMAVLTNRVEIAFTEETALNVRRAIENIQQVSEQLTGLVGSQRAAIDGVAANLEQTTVALGAAAETIRRTFTRIEASISDGELEQIMDNVARTSTQLDSLSSSLLAASVDFREMVTRADGALAVAESVGERVQRGEGNLGLLLQDTTLYADLIRTNMLMQELLKDIKENPRKYVKLSIF
jgi:phospholipid/cholesterol/gamma-HCH transport system substrate-binding protein